MEDYRKIAIELGQTLINKAPETREDVERMLPELRESEDERIRKLLVEAVTQVLQDQYCSNRGVSKEKVIAWLEKQGEQKPADKVEPKFHEGEWIVQGRNILKIRCVGDEYYCFETVGGYVDSMLVSEIDSLYHLWTIQDAKDGDVLVTENKNIFIFKSISDCTIYDYCGLYFGKFENSSAAVNDSTAVQLPIGYVPATKEQRDTLERAITNAGYRWDKENLKLEKI